MDSYHITGGKRLAGVHALSGAKNAVLPILAASILAPDTSRIENCPNLSDVRTMAAILRSLGCKISREGDSILVNASTIDTYAIPEELMKGMRSSVFLMGPMLARCGRVTLSHPGGCAIGKRPIDIHLAALQKLGILVQEKDGCLVCTADRLTGTTVPLSFPSVGATENVMMAAVAADGTTRIKNPAREPEIQDLADYLNQCGASVYGAGGSEIVVEGRDRFHGCVHRVIPDRIEAGTLLCAAAVTGGEIVLKRCRPGDMAATLECLSQAGCTVRANRDEIHLQAPPRLSPVSGLQTKPYPGFPTDMQSQLLAALTVADGVSDITETIFENRFMNISQLEKMGAKVSVEGRKAIVTGVEKLTGARLRAKDLRGGASLVIAGLAAEGTTTVEDICHIDRGYDGLETALRNLGADIVRVQKEDGETITEETAGNETAAQ